MCRAGGDTVLTNNFATDPTLVVAAVPTLPEWAMIVLTALLALAGFVAMRRRAT
jgi:exosortase sorting signal-containing protein